VQLFSGTLGDTVLRGVEVKVSLPSDGHAHAGTAAGTGGAVVVEEFALPTPPKSLPQAGNSNPAAFSDSLRRYGGIRVTRTTVAAVPASPRELLRTQHMDNCVGKWSARAARRRGGADCEVA
jgi:hypothetical protein